MPANAVVRARIDKHIKKEATVVLEAMGLTVSDAFRIMLTRVAREKALPFEDCHIKPDLVPAYRKPDGLVLQLVRLGTHNELGL